MNRALTLLWIIIILGAIFIAVQLTKPETIEDIEDEEEPTTPEEEVTEEEIPEEPIIIPQDTEETEETKDPLTYTEYISTGDKYLSEGQFYKAIDNYQRASHLNPNSTTPLIKLGYATLLANDPKSSEEAFKKAEELDPDSLEIQIGIARSYLNQRNIEAAKELVWRMDTSNYLVKYYTGLILILYKDFEGAKIAFEEMAEETALIDPVLKERAQIFLDAYTTFSYYKEGETIFLETLLAKTFTDVGEYEAAIPLLYDILNQKNNYRDAWIVLGYAYLNTEKILDAIDALTQAQALDEEKPETLFYLGLAHFANDEIDKAVFYLEEAEEKGFEPKDEIELRLGDLYLLQEKFSQASSKYEKVLALNTNSMDVFIRATWLNIDKLNNPEKALTLAGKALEAHPQNPMSYNLVGWALTADEKYDEAKLYLAKALEIKPLFDAVYLNLGWLYEKKGLNTLAKEHYQKAYTLGAGNSIANIAATRFNNLQINISQP